MSEQTTPDPWQRLRQFTAARIALGRSGGSLPTREWLDFKLAHARARDAVHQRFDSGRLEMEIIAFGMPALIVNSAVPDPLTYLQRPDLGRRLAAESRRQLNAVTGREVGFDLAIIASDGLSALAVHRQTIPLLALLLPRLKQDGWRLAPMVIARFGRVALQDEIGALLNARLALILIGERPGLGSPDSLGAYLVHGPRLGNTDAQRNCISNIRPEGLPHPAAAQTIHYLLTEAKRRRISGIGLKDERPLVMSEAAPLPVIHDRN